MKYAVLLALVTLTWLQASTSSSANYTVSVTRKSSNLYKVDGQDVFIETRYCYVYAYSEESIINSSGHDDKLIFFHSNEHCDIKAVFGAAAIGHGEYYITVSHEDEDWYEVDGQGYFVRTCCCLSLALGESAYLTIGPYGFGTLRFDDGDECTVEGIYAKLRL